MHLEQYLQEDIGSGDITSETMFTNEQTKAVIIAKSDCIAAGLEELAKLFGLFCLNVDLHVDDGTPVTSGTKVLSVSGEAKAILKCERLALNILMRMSGIATETHTLVSRCSKLNPSIKIAATRKTTPCSAAARRTGSTYLMR